MYRLNSPLHGKVMKRHHSIPITECRTQPLKRHSDDVFIAFLLARIAQIDNVSILHPTFLVKNELKMY